MPKSKSKSRRTFTREFKVQAVQLVTEKGFSYAEAARQLGITDAQIRNWKKQFDAAGTRAFPGNGNPVEEEVQRLRAENKRLLLERDILKKAAAFFARECT
jgi:transposase